jgi:hypothetical protein
MIGLFFAAIALLTATHAFALAPYILTPAEMKSLAVDAPKALKAPIVTIVDKPASSPTGNAHDYVSYSRYYWPDPATPGGLPYLRRDGEPNREQIAKGDSRRLENFCKTVEKLAAAFAINHDPAAANRAVEWLRAWFITPETRMNPNLEFAQIQLGKNDNRGNSYGVLDARCLAQVIDALRLLQGSDAFKPGEEKAIRAWFVEYLNWLTTAKIGVKARDAANNHGTWYLAQAIPIARYVGQDDLARELCEADKKLIASQIAPDGSQPGEIARVDGLSYSLFNLDAHFQVAKLAAGLDIDLWNYTAPNGASLRAALDFLKPFNRAPADWPHKQKAKLPPGFLDPLLAEFPSGDNRAK